MMDNYIKQYMPEEWINLPQKYHGKKFDAHTHFHFSENSEIDSVLKIAEEYGIEKILGIVDNDVREKILKNYPDRFILARFLRSQKLIQEGPASLTEMVDEIYSQGYTMVKFWFAPRWKDYVKQEFGAKVMNMKLSDDSFAPVFERIQDLGLKFLIHISDPDIWYEKKYQPASYYGTKTEHLADLETVIKNYPKITFQIAHFGAQPEHLENLGRWFNSYPNFYVDTSSARWIGRELSRNPEKSRNFIEKYQDRILYGTDLSFGWTRDGSPEEYFLTRYLTFHSVFETSVQNLPLPFPDPENNNATILNGLDLSEEILEKIYWKNSVNMHNL